MSEPTEPCPVCSDLECKGDHRPLEYYEATKKLAKPGSTGRTEYRRRAAERLAFAMEILRADPTLSIEGPGGVTRQVRQKFGQGCQPDALYELKRELGGKTPVAKRPPCDSAPVSTLNECAKALLAAMRASDVRGLSIEASGEMTVLKLQRETVVLG